MFMGEYQHTIDDKGRVIIPARLREDLGEHFVATKGLDGCLFVYPMDEWAILETKLKQLPLTRANARAFVRFFLSGAAELESDKQGRVLLPMNLREYAHLDKDVVTIGVSNRLEVWDQEIWHNYSSQAKDTFAELAENLVDLGI